MITGAIDIGGTKTIAAIVSSEGKIIDSEYRPTVTADCYAHLESCCELIKSLALRNGLTASELLGIGVNLPGMVDQETGVLISAPFAKWYNIPVAEFIAEALGNEKIIIDNDVNSCASGEMYFGYKSRYKDFIWMTISTGVGAAVVLDGKIIRGYKGFAGEMGHLKVEYDRPRKCPCGQYGCLEAHASGTAITAMVQEKVSRNIDFRKEFDEKHLSCDAKSCANLAYNGNITALKIYETAADYIARGMAYGINLLNPEAIILGGGVADSRDLLFPTIEKSIRKYAVTQSQQVKIKYTKLGYNASLLGAVSLVLDSFGSK